VTALEGRAALVTGASRGIGLAIATVILEAGGRVCLTARGAEGLAAARAALDGGDRVLTVAGASDDPEHRRAAVAATVERLGGCHILVNNAGINPVFGPVIDQDLGAWRKVHEVNVVAALGWAQEAWRAWMAAHGGVILNVASASGLEPAAGLGAYGVSKAALIHLTRQLAQELAPGVRVNALAPAVVRTQFARRLYEGREAAVAATYPLGRIGEPTDVAAAARFLLGDEAGWITGQTVVVDGGLAVRGALG